MPKKLIGVRLEEETINKLETQGKPSTIIRSLILESFQPKQPPKVIEKIKKIEKIVEVIKLVETGSQDDWSGFEREILRDVIQDEINRGMPEWYLIERKKYFKRRFGEDFDKIQM